MTDVIESQMGSPNFVKLKDELLNHPDGVALYEDPYFPAKYSILYNKVNVDLDSTEIIWRRPGQLSKDPCLLEFSSNSNDTKYYRGKLTPYWFPILMSILKKKNMFELVIPNFSSQNTFNQDPFIIMPTSMSYCGAFQFSFRRGSILENVIIDDRLPTTINCHLLSAMSSNLDEFLPSLIEKAYAKFIGGYYNLEKENFFSAVMDFTGGLAESITRTVNEDLITEMDICYRKIKNMIGDSFALCQFDLENDTKSSSSSYQIYIVTGQTEIPPDPPNGLVKDIVDTISNTRGEFMPALRLLSLSGLEEHSPIDKHILHDWQKCTPFVRKKYGLEFNNSKEIWVTIDDILQASRQVVIINMLYRNSIVALAKKQPYWKFTFFENFWHRDSPRGNVETIGEEILKNKQYLFVVNREEGCALKIVLTNIQKYVDLGANIIQLGMNTQTGIVILEVEKNRIFRAHDLSHTKLKPIHIDFQVGRYIIISTYLERGRYIIIPWISDGAGAKYTLQLFSSISDSETTYLELDIPKQQFCISCQIKQTAFYTKNSFKSLYTRNSADFTPSSQRKVSTIQADICDECRAIYPKRASRISVIGAMNILLTTNYQLPNFFFKIICEKQTFISKIIKHTLSPQWNEHFLFYRLSDENSGVNIQVFCENKLGFKSRIFSHTFSEKDLRNKSSFCLPFDGKPISENKLQSNQLLVEIQNYFLSEFNNA